jgi:AGZA family xanthine/uracil permease-like MFS transporter
MKSNKRTALWVPGDWNGFFGLGTNSLLNILVMTGLLLGVVQLPTGLVFGRVLPAVGLMLCIGNFYYAYMARKLGVATGRGDVTALPSGPSVPHMFIVVFAIMLPVRLQTGDPILAWHAGLAWVFIEGLVLFVGAFVAPWVRKVTPRAALLGTLAGVSIAFIALNPAMKMYLTPIIGLVALVIVLGGWFADVKYPLGIPAGLVAVGVGAAIGWITGRMDVAAIGASFEHLGVHIPLPAFKELFNGLSRVAPLLVTAIPFGVYDFIEAMDNVESAAAAGDEYNLREVLIVEGIASSIGTILGSPFANAVYIGHPGWKKVGGRIGYSIATGFLVFGVTVLGVVPFLLSIIPLEAILPILLYIGALIGAQAFQATPRSHAPAVVIALVPHFAAWGITQVNGVLSAAGLTVEAVGLGALADSGVLYRGLEMLGGGAIVTGLVLGAVVVFLIDGKPIPAAAYAGAGAVLSFFGFMHGEAIGLGVSPEIAAGYLLMAAICVAFSRMGRIANVTHDTTSELKIHGKEI